MYADRHRKLFRESISQAASVEYAGADLRERPATAPERRVG